mgnify:CR=1 FL=1
MARTDTLGNFLTDVADSIRTKKGTTDKILASNFDTEIESIESGDTIELTDASYMFYNKARLEQLTEILPLCNKATKMSSMFANITNYNTPLDISLLKTSSCVDMSGMFQYCNGSAFYNLDLSSFDTSKVTNMGSMFYSSAIQTPNLSNFETSKVTSMNSMFSSCNGITSLDLSNFSTSNVTSMYYMFKNCGNLTSLNLGNFETSNVTSMHSMFENCKKLTSLDLSSFDTSKVKEIPYIFSGCTLLKEINISNFDLSSATWISSMFSRCSSLTTITGCLQNLGQAYLTTSSANYSNYKLDLSSCSKLTEQSLINMLNGLYDIATKGCKTQQVVLGSTNLAKLTSEAGQQALSNAQAKGWTIS